MAKQTKQNKKKKWIRPRHTVVRHTLGPFFRAYCILKYKAKIRPFKEEKKRQYLVLFNHQTAFDQFFVALSFRKHLYFLASEDIFSKGFISTMLRYLVAPIPIKKQTTDVRAIMNCMRVAKEGGSISLAPEGNRTYSGRTEYMSPAIASLARKIGLPIALYHIKGGYGVQPRWADDVRRGRIECYVSRVIEPEEYMALSDNELFELIKEGLYVDESHSDIKYYGKKNAEYLERVFYYCPHCGFSEFVSRKDVVECTKCHTKVRYLPNKEFKGIDCDFEYKCVSEWYDAQSTFMNSLNPDEYSGAPVFSDTASLSEVVPNKKKLIMDESAKIELYGDRISISYKGGEMIFPFDATNAVTVLGRNKVNIYHDGKIYQLKGAKSFNALKYVHMFNRYSNILKGEANAVYLGL